MLDDKVILAEAQRVLQEEGAALQRAATKITDDFARAVRLLADAPKVIVTGVGKSGLVGRKIAATLVSTGTTAVFLHPVEALHGDVGIIGRGDVAVLLSKSGSSDELLRLFPVLRRAEITTVGILGAKDSALGRLVDLSLDASVQREACPLRAAPTTSTAVAMALGDALAVALMKLRDFTSDEFALRHPLGQLGRNLSIYVGDIMHKGAALPLVEASTSFREAIIEMTDKALGCVGVVGPNRKLLGLITDGDVRRTLQHHIDIRPLRVEDVMTTRPVLARTSMLIGEALSLMENRERQISVLAVVDEEGCFIGLIRVHDIVRAGL